MKIHIDRDGCIECSACETACAAVFELKNGEKAAIVAQYQAGSPAEGEVGKDLEKCAKEAEDCCPVVVISTEM